MREGLEDRHLAGLRGCEGFGVQNANAVVMARMGIARILMVLCLCETPQPDEDRHDEESQHTAQNIAQEQQRGEGLASV
jgi:hypothetical protein